MSMSEKTPYIFNDTADCRLKVTLVWREDEPRRLVRLSRTMGFVLGRLDPSLRKVLVYKVMVLQDHIGTLIVRSRFPLSLQEADLFKESWEESGETEVRFFPRPIEEFIPIEHLDIPEEVKNTDKYKIKEKEDRASLMRLGE